MGTDTLPTPLSCYVDFCLIPVRAAISPSIPPLPLLRAHPHPINTSQVGTGSLSVAKEVAEVQKLLRESGLKYTMHSAGTTVGAWSLPSFVCQL